MVTFGELVSALRRLEIPAASPVIVHASLSAFGRVQGGVGTLLGALLAVFPSAMMPAFTYKTMLIPEAGPEGNAMEYGTGEYHNAMAQFFRPDMPVDRLIGALAEALRRYPGAQRSMHPILSFTGVNVAEALNTQTLREPLAPLRVLTQQRAWILLLGVDHIVNTSIHLGEKQAGRKQFIRWALTPGEVVECPGFTGCSDGFGALAPVVAGIACQTSVGNALLQGFPMAELVEAARLAVVADPSSLLCNHSYCERCEAVRAQLTLASAL